jgi:asparagine synthetase B (glutamine-hydrolysing)
VRYFFVKEGLNANSGIGVMQVFHKLVALLRQLFSQAVCAGIVDEFFDAVPDVIQDIESYDITTVRASVGNWLVSKFIAEKSDCKVVFNGDGSDEVFGSYKYFYNAPSDEAFEAESARLLKDIHYFDVHTSFC